MKINGLLKFSQAFAITITLSTLFFYSCKKMTGGLQTEKIDNTEKFFTIPTGTNEITKRVIAEIRKRNNSKEFVNKFASEIGYPVWNKVLERLAKKSSSNSIVNETDSLVYIPLVAEGQQVVSGYILAKIETDYISLLYTLAKDYKAYSFITSPNTQNEASQFALLTMVLNKNVLV